MGEATEDARSRTKAIDQSDEHIILPVAQADQLQNQ